MSQSRDLNTLSELGWPLLFPDGLWINAVISYHVLDGYRFFLMGHGWLPLFLNNSNTCTVRAPCPVLPLRAVGGLLMPGKRSRDTRWGGLWCSKPCILTGFGVRTTGGGSGFKLVFISLGSHTVRLPLADALAVCTRHAATQQSASGKTMKGQLGLQLEGATMGQVCFTAISAAIGGGGSQ